MSPEQQKGFVNFFNHNGKVPQTLQSRSSNEGAGIKIIHNSFISAAAAANRGAETQRY